MLPSLPTCKPFSAQIHDETDTKIELPTEKSDSDAIVVTGRKENVERACAMIRAIEKEMVGGGSKRGGRE